MSPAFSSIRHATAWALLLAALLVSPLVIARLGLLDRAEVYPALPAYAGPVAHLQRQIFEERGDLDVAFVGSSFMWSAIDAPFVKQEFSRLLGRDAAVTVIASVWPGLDRDYIFLNDLLARRRVGLLVLQFPNRNRPTDDPAADVNRVSDQPHVEAYRLFLAGDVGAIQGELAPRDRAALYSGTVLGLPRHLLSLVRPDYMTPTPSEATLGARFESRGYYGARYEPFRPAPPTIQPEEMTFGPQTKQMYRFFDEELPPYQMRFVKLIAELVERYEVPVVLLHIPQANELDADIVEERMNWLEATGLRATMVGVPPSRLFGRFDDAEAKRFFVSDHLNENGAIYFTRAVMPALWHVFEEHAHER